MLTLLMSMAFGADGVVDRVAAVVDDDIVLLSDVYAMGSEFIAQKCTTPFNKTRCVHEAELQILDALIKQALIKRELDRLAASVGSADVDQALDSIVRDYGMADRDALRKEVTAAGLTWDAYRQQIRDSLQVQRFQQRVLAPRVTVTDDEVKDLYDRTARGQASEAVVLDALGIVLPPDEDARRTVFEQATQLVADLNAGELTFDEARETYDGAGLGAAFAGKPFRQGELTKAVDEAVFAAPLKEVLEPLQVGNVLMLVRVNEKREVEADVRPFDEVSPALRNQLMTERVAEAEQDWYQRTRREVLVKVLLPEPA